MSTEIKSNTTGNPQKFGRYIVKSILGEGAMGRVYLAEDPVLQRQLAVKVIALEKTLDETTRREYLERFAIEARASARLSHPSIVAVHDAGQQNGVPWIAFEYVKGEGLDQIIRHHKMLPYEKVRIIAVQIASALHHAHEHHIVHRDVKPANILLDSRTGIAKLTDFGVVKAPWTGLTQSGTSVGSPGYMSPEQIDGSKIDHRSDLFSLGVVMYEMLTGKHPFVRETVPATFYATISENYEPILKICLDIPLELEKAVKGLLTSNRENRIASALDLIKQISRKHDELGSGHLHLSGRKNRPQSLIRTITGRFNIREIAVTIAEYIKTNRKPAIQKTLELLDSMGKRLRPAVEFVKNLIIEGKKRFQDLPEPARNKLNIGATVLFLVIISIGTAVTLNKIFKPAPEKKPLIQLEPEVPSELLYRFDQSLSNGIFSEARAIRDSLGQNKDLSKWVNFLNARMELVNGRYSEAIDSFTNLKKTGGKQLINNQMPRLITDIENRFVRGRAPEPLVYLATHVLSIHDYKRASELLYDNHYWKRWNMVRVFESAGKKVDMVKIHILDLQTAASVSTRKRAAEKLGELGDPRAIPALKKARDKGFRDPFVASAAGEILERYFSDAE